MSLYYLMIPLFYHKHNNMNKNNILTLQSLFINPYELMNTKIQDLEKENADLKRSPDIITAEMTIIGPHGEQDTVASIKRRYEIIKQLADVIHWG